MKAKFSRTKEAGFTLIEVLISSAILAALIYLATLSYSLFLRIWEQGGTRADRVVNRYRSDILLRESVESIYDYYVTDPANERIGFYYPFFKGGRRSAEFVTLSSVFARGLPAVARITVEKTGERDGGHLQVVYEENPMQNFYVKYNKYGEPFEYSMVIFDNVKDFRMRYFGLWVEETPFGKATGVPVEAYKWQDRFDGKTARTIPQKIQMKVVQQDGGDEELCFHIMARNIFKQAFFRPEF